MLRELQETFLQKQLSMDVLIKGVLKICSKLTGDTHAEV